MRFGKGYSHWVMGADEPLMGGFGHRGHSGQGGQSGLGLHGHGAPGDRGFRGRGGRRRLFDGEELQLLLLALIAESPRHGYDLIREIEARSGGGYAPSPGVVYPTLTMLDEIGHVDELKEAGARRRFAITDGGRALLDSKREQVEGLLARLAELDAEHARTDRAPVRRAMIGLHMALRERLASGDGDRAHDIAAILDEATRQIERL